MGARLCRWLQRHEATLWAPWTAAVLLATATAFLLPALRHTGGRWPAPLDDVYIYFGFARSWTQGHPMSWFPGNGYSSGCTSPLYPLLLAPGYALGLTGTRLGAWASGLALACLFDLCRSLRRLVGPGLASFAAPVLVVAIPLLDWSWLSGMETALLGALLGRAVFSADRAIHSAAPRRARRQLQAGGWIALVLLTRPEAVVLVAALALSVVYWARSLATLPSLARALGPGTVALGAQTLANRAFTGEWAPAGAVRKLYTSSPFVEPGQLAVEYLRNSMVLLHQAFDRALGVGPYDLALPLLALAALTSRRYRPLAAALLLGAAGSIALVCLNSTARFQNYRYAAPALAMLVIAATLGVARLARATPRLRRRRRGRLAAKVLAGMAVAAAVRGGMGQLLHQTDHFARASANILEQQGEVARRLAAQRPRPRRVLVGDAGAIPYLSGIPPLDGLGLGGYRGLPFARASVQGIPAVVELIERLPPGERPDWLALYPSWWPGLADRFGRPVDAVRITDNVICAADEKVIYRADWSTLASGPTAPTGTVDALDVGDLLDERAHRYRFPAPDGGQLVGRTLRAGHGDASPRRYDAGRLIPIGSPERLTVAASVTEGPAALVARSDPDQPVSLQVTVLRRKTVVWRRRISLSPPAPGTWGAATIPLGTVRGTDRLEIVPLSAPWRSFHYWLVRR